jgi:hypothetical protein
MVELLLHLTADGGLHLDMAEEITAAVVITRDGRVVQPATAALLGAPADSGPGSAPGSGADTAAPSSADAIVTRARRGRGHGGANA